MIFPAHVEEQSKCHCSWAWAPNSRVVVPHQDATTAYAACFLRKDYDILRRLGHVPTVAIALDIASASCAIFRGFRNASLGYGDELASESSHWLSPWPSCAPLRPLRCSHCRMQFLSHVFLANLALWDRKTIGHSPVSAQPMPNKASAEKSSHTSWNCILRHRCFDL